MRPGDHSRVDAVILALKATLDGPLETAGVSLLDARQPSAASQRRSLVIGEGPGAVGIRREPSADFGPGGYHERMRIRIQVHSASGSKEPALRRPDVAEVLDLIEDALTASPTLGGVCDEVYLGPEESWDQVASGSGATVVATTTIETETMR